MIIGIISICKIQQNLYSFLFFDQKLYNFLSQIGNFTTYIAINFRMWAGVHFQDAIDSIKPIATRIGKMAAKLVLKYANAEPAPVPATAR